ncbi:acyltransferase family protein [Pseudomonas tolaasii]|uniref:acyltransferase family protein n=1 Tax=Pseudomonas tolaasii TaxID=29442 RepID=UPI00210CF068|nr:acyltransferase [Pseudomonas tolaasii]WLH50508.1 acyltransferase [Pseudomonas tolaasii]
MIKHVEILPDGKPAKMGNNFHLLRYVLAALVIYSHSFGLLGLPEAGVFRYGFGTLAVKCFFALSGYLITLSCLRSASLYGFALNRTLRIAPALIVALIFSHFIGVYFNKFIGNPVEYIVNGPVWTLSWEVLCYALCGFLWWFGALNKNVLTAIVVVAWGLYCLIPGSNDASAVISPMILLFFTGSVIALNEQQFNLRISGPVFFVLLIVLCVDTGGSIGTWFFEQIPFLYGPGMSVMDYYTLLFLFALAFALIWLALYVKPVLNLRNDYSYGLYIYAWPVQQSLIALFSPPPLILFVSSLAVTHVLAMASWHLLEKRVLRFKV